MASDPRFFVLEPESDGPYRTSFLKADGTQRGDAPLCPKCGVAIGMRKWLPPYQVELTVHGDKGTGDYVMGSGGDLLLSERFAETFQKEGLNGFTGFHPVEVVDVIRRTKRKAFEIPRYRFVSAVFARAAIDEARSLLRRPEVVTCDECRSTGLLDGIYGFGLDLGTWSGEDVFRPRGLQATVVVSERFAQLVSDHAFTNVKLTPTEQYVWDPLQEGPPPRSPHRATP